MSGAADLVELARRVSGVDDVTALLDGRELTPVTPLPMSDEAAAADPTEPTAAVTALVHPQPFAGAGTPKISWLATQLYGHCYVRPMPRARSTADAAAVHSFRLALSAANTGRGHWEAGWQIGETSAGQAGPVGEPARRSVRRYGVEFATTPDRVRLDGPAAGATVLVPKERRELHPGYYIALGDAPWPALGTQPLLRVYWNLRAGGAPAWMAAVTAELNWAGIPFMAKLRDHPDGHERADSAVLYLPGGGDGLTHDRLAAVHATVREHLLRDVPMFTRTLAAGVSVATDPGTGLSFGQHRWSSSPRAYARTASRGGPTSRRRDTTASPARFGRLGSTRTTRTAPPARRVTSTRSRPSTRNDHGGLEPASRGGRSIRATTICSRRQRNSATCSVRPLTGTTVTAAVPGSVAAST